MIAWGTFRDDPENAPAPLVEHVELRDMPLLASILAGVA